MTSQSAIWTLPKAQRRPRHYAAALLRADKAEAARLWADAPKHWHALISTHSSNFSARKNGARHD